MQLHQEVGFRQHKVVSAKKTYQDFTTVGISLAITPFRGSRDLLPEGGVAGGEEGVLARVPAQEMGRACVGGVMFAAGPNFVQEEMPRLIGAAMEIVLEAAFFLAGGADEGAEFGFEQEILAFSGAQEHDESHRRLWQFLAFCGFEFAPSWTAAGGLAGFSFGHVGGDCTPTGRKSNGDLR
jgi:hypothetical protein